MGWGFPYGWGLEVPREKKLCPRRKPGVSCDGRNHVGVWPPGPCGPAQIPLCGVLKAWSLAEVGRSTIIEFA